jgi:hypothetical protein
MHSHIQHPSLVRPASSGHSFHRTLLPRKDRDLHAVLSGPIGQSENSAYTNIQDGDSAVYIHVQCASQVLTILQFREEHAILIHQVNLWALESQCRISTFVYNDFAILQRYHVSCLPRGRI